MPLKWKNLNTDSVRLLNATKSSESKYCEYKGHESNDFQMC